MHRVSTQYFPICNAHIHVCPTAGHEPQNLIHYVHIYTLQSAAAAPSHPSPDSSLNEDLGQLGQDEPALGCWSYRNSILPEPQNLLNPKRARASHLGGKYVAAKSVPPTKKLPSQTLQGGHVTKHRSCPLHRRFPPSYVPRYPYLTAGTTPFPSVGGRDYPLPLRGRRVLPHFPPGEYYPLPLRECTTPFPSVGGQR